MWFFNLVNRIFSKPVWLLTQFVHENLNGNIEFELIVFNCLTLIVNITNFENKFFLSMSRRMAINFWFVIKCILNWITMTCLIFSVITTVLCTEWNPAKIKKMLVVGIYDFVCQTAILIFWEWLNNHFDKTFNLTKKWWTVAIILRSNLLLFITTQPNFAKNIFFVVFTARFDDCYFWGRMLIDGNNECINRWKKLTCKKRTELHNCGNKVKLKLKLKIEIEKLKLKNWNWKLKLKNWKYST